MAVADLNAATGILGHCATVLVKDSANSPTTAAQVARELIDQDEVGFLVGPTTGSPEMSAIAVSNRSRMIHMAGASVVEATDPAKYPYVFITESVSTMQGQTILQRVAADKHLKVGVLAGPTLIPDWGVRDVQSTVRHMMTEIGLTDRLRAGGDKAVRAFVEESLRSYGPVHYRSRLANRDLTVAGTLVRRDEAVVSVQSAANRDPKRYKCPVEIDLERPNPRDHIAFNFGPRTCVGANLARIELQESVRAFLDRVPDLRIDPKALQPKFGGVQLRDFRPLHALFTPGRKAETVA